MTDDDFKENKRAAESRRNFKYDPQQSREYLTNYICLILAVQGLNILYDVPATDLAAATVIMVLLTFLAYLVEPFFYRLRDWGKQ